MFAFFDKQEILSCNYSLELKNRDIREAWISY